MPESALPEIMQSVTLRIARTTGSEIVAATRVLDIEPGHEEGVRVVVACPDDCDPLEHQPEARLEWTHPGGRTTWRAQARPGRRPYGRVWVLDLEGAPTKRQDRHHFRAVMSVPARLDWEGEPDEEDGEPIHEQRDGVTVDLSEGGFLVLLRNDPPAVGATVDTTLRIDSEELSGPATVVRHVDFPGGVGVAARFPDGSPHADKLRRAAFEAERRKARAGGGAGARAAR